MIGKKKLTKKQKLVLKELTNFKCEQCREKFKPKDLEIHRIIRKSEGGKYIGRNCMVLCKYCHRLFHSQEKGLNSK